MTDPILDALSALRAARVPRASTERTRARCHQVLARRRRALARTGWAGWLARLQAAVSLATEGRRTKAAGRHEGDGRW